MTSLSTSRACANFLLAASLVAGLYGCSGASGSAVTSGNGATLGAADDDAGSGGSGNGAGGGSPGTGGGGAGEPDAGGGAGGSRDDAGAGTDGGTESESDGGSSDDAGSGSSDSDDAAEKADGSWDLTGWTLQLPIGSTDSPTMIKNPNGFTDAYFYVDTDGSLTFMDPRTGVTTSGSKHPRSELAEDTSGWSASGTNVMTATVAVPLVPDTVTIGQIFQSPSAPSKPLLELQYVAGGKLQVLLESTNQGGTVTDKAKFDYTIALSHNAMAITINGTTTNLTVPSSFDGETFYFKWGDYDQTATAGAQTTTPGTIVKFYAHKVTHS
jgi:hypothetical protein